MPERQESERNGDRQAQARAWQLWGQQGQRGWSTTH